MHAYIPTSELIATAENARKIAGLSQQQLVKLLGMTQGHYSKVAAGKVKPGVKAEASIRRWVNEQDVTPPDADAARRAEIRRLATEISMQCIRLTELALKE